MRERTLITGVAGFIGSHCAHRLLTDGHEVLGIDDFSASYESRLTRARLDSLKGRPHFTFSHLDIGHRAKLEELVRKYRPQRVVHLASRALPVVGAGTQRGAHAPGRGHAGGAMAHPQTLEENVFAFVTLLEILSQMKIKHLVLATGAPRRRVRAAPAPFPRKETRPTTPVSKGSRGAPPTPPQTSDMSATRSTVETCAHVYAQLFSLPTTAVRVEGVYGPWGRPDTTCYALTERILANDTRALPSGATGGMALTHIDDAVEAIVHALFKAPWTDRLERKSLFQTVDVPSRRLESVDVLVSLLERLVSADCPIPRPDKSTGAVKSPLETSVVQPAERPRPVPLDEGLASFVSWYKEYRSATRRQDCLNAS